MPNYAELSVYNAHCAARIWVRCTFERVTRGERSGDGVARRRVNEMFSRGWLRHGVVIYKNVITLPAHREDDAVFPPGRRAPRR